MNVVPGSATPAIEIDRTALVAFILARPEPIVVLEAPAGMGKSVLLRQLAARTGAAVETGAAPPPPTATGVRLWDMGTDIAAAALPRIRPNGPAKLVIAKRPDTVVDGLARAIVYGHALVLGVGDLLLSAEEIAGSLPRREATRLAAQTAGWPLLLPHARGRRPDERVLADMLERDFLQHLPVGPFVALGEVLAGRPARIEPPTILLPLAEAEAGGPPTLRIEALRLPLADAYRAAWEKRAAVPDEVEGLAAALLAHGRPTQAITTLQRAGRYDAALDIMKADKGFFYIYRYGGAAFDTVLAGFPQEFVLAHESLIICAALQALKRGDVARARQLVSDHFGGTANQPARVFGDTAAYSLQFRFFRIIMLIYEDVFVTDDLFEQIFGLISELPADAHEERGSFYNSLLEFYIRRRRFAEAEDVAVRARQHYIAARVPILKFYISLHRAVMRLMEADASEAQRFAEEAAGDLKACGFDSPSDARLLALLQACVDYEGGRAEPLARFLSFELDDFSHSEIWPTVIDLALHYGSQALSEHFSTIAARSFLDRWRVYQVHNRQFQAMIDIREATVLQSGNRWQEAAEKLASVRSRISRDYVMTSDMLARLQGRDEIALALTWLRQLVFETPLRPGLDRQLTALLDNLELTGRQRISLEIWLAYVARRQRDLSRSRSQLQKTLERAARLGAHGPLAEERYFLAELIGNQRIQEFLHTSPPIRQMLRRLTDSGLASSPAGSRSGLSRRETKVLMMIAEGGSNKFIANALGVTEATVKYHLGNVYRKLGCRRRREAISAARALGLVH